MTLYLIGLGVYREPPLPKKWLDKIINSKYIYFEGYTSPAPYDVHYLQRYFGRNDIEYIGRIDLEMKTEELVEKAVNEDVTLLIYGDPLIATTHKSLILTCIDKGVKYDVYHNVSSYLYAISESGLDIYKIGVMGTLVRGGTEINRTTLNKIKYNLENGYHSPILLEYSAEEGYVMHPIEAINIVREETTLWMNTVKRKSYIIVLMALGFEREYKNAYKYSEIDKIRDLPTGYPSILIITAKLHFMERLYIDKILRGRHI